MKMIYHYSRIIISVAAAAFVAAGCTPRTAVTALAPSIASASEFASDKGDDRYSPRHLAILEPEMFIYDVSAGGIFEYRDDWSKRAAKRVMVSAALKLAEMNYGSIVLPDAVSARELFRIKTKMRYHSSVFQSAFFANEEIAARVEGLTYSVGRLDSLCDAFGVDGFLYIYGFEEKFSKERRAFIGQEAKERTFMAAMLVEKNGRIAWYRHMMVSGFQDMRDEPDAARMMEAMFE